MVAIAKNVAKAERIVRIILGIALIFFGFFLASLWKFVIMFIGLLLLLTACVGY